MFRRFRGPHVCLVGGRSQQLGERVAGVLASRVRAGWWCRSIAVSTVLCAVGDFSTQSRQPLTKHLPSRPPGVGR